MAPEYGATCGIFPIDDETIDYMRLSNRDESQINLIKKYSETIGLTRSDCDNAIYSENIELDVSKVLPSIAGPKRPQDRINLKDAKASYKKELEALDPKNKASEVTIKDETSLLIMEI